MNQTRADWPEPDAQGAHSMRESTLELARRLGSRHLRQSLAIQVIRTASRLCFSGLLALLVAQLIMGVSASEWTPLAICGLLGLMTVAGLAADRSQARGETHVAGGLREFARNRIAVTPARLVQALPAGRFIVSMQRHPQAVATLVISHQVATLMMAIGPLLAVAALIMVSWQAALTLLALTPVMIVFFVLVGDTIRRRAEKQEKAFGRLAGQFADRIRVLPTILANHSLNTEAAKLHEQLEAYAYNTLNVLKIAFVNAGIIDFFASLSIAILAVFLALGHLHLAAIPGFKNLELWQSLFILMIAPEYFAPFRRYAEQYHAKAEGLAAAAALDQVLNPVASSAPALPHSDADAFIIERSHGLLAISGPSGSGKSTLLRRLAGIDCDPPAARPIAWIATDSFVPQGTLADAIAWQTGCKCPTRLKLAAQRVGLLDDALLPGGLEAPIENGGANLSGGQRIRIAVARACLTGRAVMADEPTAKLDPENAARIRLVLKHMATRRQVVVATHDPQLLRLADKKFELRAANDSASEIAA